MKKILTLIVLMATALTSRAQGFGFQYQGKMLADGETVIISAEEDFFGDLSCETNDVMNPTDGLLLMSFSGMPLTVSATLQITYSSLEADVMQWCMGGECTPFNGATMLAKRFTVAGSEQVQFDAIGIQGEGYLQATLKATVGLETHQVVIMFANGNIDAISSPKAFHKNTAETCDLRGRMLKGHPAAGIYIVTEGGQHRKVAFK